jgi:hypothetical protein
MLLFGCRGHGASFSVRGQKIKTFKSLLHCNNNAKQIKWGQIPFKQHQSGAQIYWGQIDLAVLTALEAVAAA